MGAYPVMLAVPGAPPNGITTERAHWVALPDSAGSFLKQRAHPKSLYLEFCNWGEGGHIKKTQLYLKSPSYQEPVHLGETFGWSSVKSHHTANMLTLLCLSGTSKTCGEGELPSEGSRRGMELNTLLNPRPASGHDPGPNPLIHQIRLSRDNLLFLLKDMLPFTFLWQILLEII